MNWKIIRIIDTFAGIPFILCLRLWARLNSATTKSGPKNGTPERILLIKFWGIGNFFMLLPTINALRTKWPDAEIDFLTLHCNREAVVITGMVNHITTIDTSTIINFIATWKESISTLKPRNYDLILDFEQFARFSAIMAFQIGAANIIGYKTSGQHRHYLYSSPVDYENSMHMTASFQSLANAAGADPASLDPLPWIVSLQSSGTEMLKQLGLSPDAPVVLMHIGTSDNFMERRWPPRYYAALADRLAGRYGMNIIFTGLPEESHLIEESMRHIASIDRVRNLGGKLSFPEYLKLVMAVDLVVSADTSAVHMASAANVPVAGLYGPNTPALYGPWGRNGLALYLKYDCSPCITNFNAKINTCRHSDGRGACMESLSVDFVLAEIEKAYCVSGAFSRPSKSVTACT